MGTRPASENASDSEYHEMVVMRLDDGEDRSVEELLALHTAPGRYLATCFIQVGADPAVAEQVFSAGGYSPEGLTSRHEQAESEKEQIQ